MHIPTALHLRTAVLLASALIAASSCNTTSPEQNQVRGIPQQEVSQAAVTASDSASVPQAVPRKRSFITPFMAEPSVMADQLPDKEKYHPFDNNGTVETQDQPVSTFSIDVDTGAYSNVRRFLQNGQLPPSDSVRVEELLNYFSYDYAPDTNPDKPFSIVTELGPSPWNERTQLLHIGLKGYVPDDIDSRPANLTFLIDVSGSMSSNDKLGLLKSAMSLMVQELDENDTVSIVVYAGSSGVALQPTPGNERRQIERALSNLQAGGATHGSEGIELAYELALDNFVENGINRVILATDGDFNVGISDTSSLVKLIEEKRKSGIALTTLGFGMGNYNDYLMEQLADAGDGNYAYIDTLGEARKVLVDELRATLVTIASDVKIQIEFNPATVSEYRLIGYTNRILANEDFNDDKVDAGEIGAGHTVTALYEVALNGDGGERNSPRRYNSTQVNNDNTLANEIAEVRLRYKRPGSDSSKLTSQVVQRDDAVNSTEAASDAFRFSASVAAFGQLLREDSHVGDYAYSDAHELARTASADDQYGYRAEFVRLVDLAQSLDNLQQAARFIQ